MPTTVQWTLDLVFEQLWDYDVRFDLFTSTSPWFTNILFEHTFDLSIVCIENPTALMSSALSRAIDLVPNP